VNNLAGRRAALFGFQLLFSGGGLSGFFLLLRRLSGGGLLHRIRIEFVTE